MEEENVVYIRDYVEKYDGIFGIEECANRYEREIFNQELKRFGLKNVRLLVPERPYEYPFYDIQLSHSEGNFRDGYFLEIKISPNGVQYHKARYSWGDFLKAQIFVLPYVNMPYEDVFRSVLRRELWMITLGIRDVQSAQGKIGNLAKKIFKFTNKSRKER